MNTMKSLRDIDMQSTEEDNRQWNGETGSQTQRQERGKRAAPREQSKISKTVREMLRGQR